MNTSEKRLREIEYREGEGQTLPRNWKKGRKEHVVGGSPLKE